jgi:agmatine deiminase
MPTMRASIKQAFDPSVTMRTTATGARTAATMFKKLESLKVPFLPDNNERYNLPEQDAPHEGTWLQWPHNHGWDKNHTERYDRIWIEMTMAIHKNEKVHVVVYDDDERKRVRSLLTQADLSQIDFTIAPSDDVWIRDHGPVFCFNQDKKLFITDWKFNGWGDKEDYELSDNVPKIIAEKWSFPIISVPMVNEGGSVEVDGRGTLLAKRSSILNRNRNPGWKQADAERYFGRYLGVTNFIWLDGAKGRDITDDHVDGTARFACGDTIVTTCRDDFEDRKEYDCLAGAQDVNGKPYRIVHLPLTSKRIPTLKDHGIYTNYYVANGVVLMPTYDDPNDAVAQKVLQHVYPDRTVVGIECTDLYKDGGVLNCVTQQQPLA